ncbi:MAG: GIY-YIG nuclease family protein [bacterium]|nr:GIY-YIG nuclease family protein [bacterium]
MITKEQISTIPTTNGIYIFKQDDVVLYVGKSVNIKARFKSHIENARLDQKEFLIVNESNKIEFIITDSEFNALLLESELIKKYLPKYNVIWKDNKSYLYIKITIKEAYPKILLVRKENDEKSLYFGPFSSVRVCMLLIKELRRIVPFCTQSNLSKRACFYSKIGLCNPCPNEIELIKNKGDVLIAKSLTKQYKNNIKMVINMLNGNTIKIFKSLQKDIKLLSKKEKFEDAIGLRNKLIKLEQLFYKHKFFEGIVEFDFNQSEKALKELLLILQKYFTDLQSLDRIECYDISNFNQKQATASMVTLVNGLIDKSQYRKFKIKNEKLHSDFEMIEEVLNRRLHNDWPLPQLIIIDGGKPQVRIALQVLHKLSTPIPLIGIAKNPDRLIVGINELQTVRLSFNNIGFNLIRLIRDESHRFAKKYHLLLREKHFLL